MSQRIAASMRLIPSSPRSTWGPGWAVANAALGSTPGPALKCWPCPTVGRRPEPIAFTRAIVYDSHSARKARIGGGARGRRAPDRVKGFSTGWTFDVFRSLKEEGRRIRRRSCNAAWVYVAALADHLRTVATNRAVMRAGFGSQAGGTCGCLRTLLDDPELAQAQRLALSVTENSALRWSMRFRPRRHAAVQSRATAAN